MLLAIEKRSSLQFVLLCSSHFLFACSFNMPIPELPAYLESMGGKEYLGLIIALTTLMAGLSRPVSGKLADRVGRIPVMIYGSMVCVVCSLLYPVLTTVGGFLFLRFLHGFSTGFKPTGASAYVADIVPENRRGQAMGVMGLCSTMGLSLGPAIGSYATTLYGLHGMFLIASLFAMVSVAILAGMKETLPQKQPFRWSALPVSRKEIFEPRAAAPAIVTFLLYVSYGAIMTLVPDLSSEVGLRNKGLFFTFFTISSVGIRMIAGKAPDQYGRIPVLKMASWIMVLSMVLIACTGSGWWLLGAALVYGLAMGLTSPATLAWTVDLAHPERRARALATMYVAMEAGIGLGALISGWWYRYAPHGIFTAFAGMAFFSLCAFLYLQFLYPVRQLRRCAVRSDVDAR